MREFLKGLGLEPNVINTIMAEYGKNFKTIRDERDDYKTKVEEYEKNGSQEFETFKKSVALEKALSGSKAKDINLLQKLIDNEKLNYEEKNGKYEITGLDEQLASIKTTHGYLFEEEPKKEEKKEPVISLGEEHSSGTPTNSANTLVGALKEKYNK